LLKDTEFYIPPADERTLQNQIQELICYIWDNYLQVSETATDIFLMGIGNAYLGVKVLLINRGMSPPPENSVSSFRLANLATHAQTASPAFREW